MIGLDPERQDLLDRGSALMSRWCKLNRVDPPAIELFTETPPEFGVCAYYRFGTIYLWPRACARIGRAGRQWSYPGYVVDRTPYGVLAHELGHHVDGAHGAAGGIVAHDWRKKTGEPPLTGYCPNDNEWFAEHFRLYVTNPDLLRFLRPHLFALLAVKWPVRAENRPWREVLAGADRQIRAAENKIRKVRR